MSTIVRNILAVIVGFVIGSMVNMSIINFGPLVIPNPPGFDVTDFETMKQTFHLLQPVNFIVPFAAHSLGTLVGALFAFLIAGSRKTTFAFVIGIITLLGGITAAFMFPAPMWFVAVDLVAAYIPMAWIATLIGGRISSEQ